MEIEKLKKRLLKEELRIQRSRGKSRRSWVIVLVLIMATALAAGGFYWYNLDTMLERDFARAERLVENGSYREAAEAFAALQKRHPHFEGAPQALFKAAEIHSFYRKNYHEAVLCYLLVEKHYPQSELAGRSLVQVADIYKTRLRDFARAIVAYQKILDRGNFSEADRVQYEIGDAYFHLNNFEQARIEFDIFLKNYPDSPRLPEVAYRIAVTASLEEELERAAKGFRQVIEQWPDNPYALEARFSLAGVLEEMEELKASLKILQGLQGIYPNGEILEKKILKVKARIAKKKKAI